MPPELYGPAGALATLAFMVVAFIHGDLVPGYLYRQEREQRMIAETQALRNTEAIQTIAETVQVATRDRRDSSNA